MRAIMSRDTPIPFMLMTPHAELPPASPKRRLILVTAGAAVCAGVATILWPRESGEVAAIATGSSTPSPVAKPPTVSQFKAAPVAESAPAASVTAMNREWFIPHIDSEFVMDSDQISGMPVKLIEVSPAKILTDKDHHVSYTTFSLVFRGPKHLPSDSRVCHLKHEVLGELDLFLTPVGLYKDQMRYEAVFSQRI